MENSWNTKFSGAPAAEKARVRAGSEFHSATKILSCRILGIGTAKTEMDEGKPAVVTARDSETDSEQRAEPDGVDKM
jgi:hypothetical protein